MAIIGGGVDYMRPEIAARLARDGEGELVGLDFIDNDRLPLDRCAAALKPVAGCATGIALVVLQEANASSLVIARATTDAAATLVAAVAMASQSRARIVLVTPPGTTVLSPWFIAEAADRFPQLLFIAPARGRSASPKAANALMIAAADDRQPGASAEVAVPLPALGAGPHAFPPDYATAIAAARIAALAARLLAVAPELDPAGLKRRILELAVTGKGTPPIPAIGQPERAYRLD